MHCLVIVDVPSRLTLNVAKTQCFSMMDRRTFTKLSVATLVAAPSHIRAQPKQNVIVIGAGAAGLTAAYHLKSAGVGVRIVEASNRWGGRLKRLTGFSEVPLDLGAEWIHDEPTILGQIVGKGETDLDVGTIEYRPQTYQFWHNGRLSSFDTLRYTYREVKFHDTTWYGFFERFIVPTIQDTMELNVPVSHIASNSGGVAVHLRNGRVYEADKALVTVPLSVLQRGNIGFSPDLTPPHIRELQDIDFGSGFKVFLKFKERFYPDILMEGPRLSALADTWAQKIYYDAAFGKPTTDNVLGLFAVSDSALPRASLDDETLLREVLAELEDIFGSVVSRTFIAGKVQNWSNERFIMGSYSMTNHGWQGVDDILAPMAGKVFFAGEALGGDAQSTVHGAAFSAIDAARDIQAR